MEKLQPVKRWLLGSYTIRDMYKHYRTLCKKANIKPVNRELFGVIHSENMNCYSQELLSNPYGVKLPHGLGKLKILKRNFRMKNGVINVNRLRIDWKKSKEFKKTIYYMNEHSNGYTYSIRWIKNTAINNIKYYNFKPCRTLSITLGDRILNKKADFFIENGSE